jgi:hypothetical protein
MRVHLNPPLSVLLLLSVAASLAGAEPPKPTAEQSQFFETNVRPLLLERCHRCHGPRKQQGGLRLDARESVLKGGDSGPVVLPGKPEESLLLKAAGTTGRAFRRGSPAAASRAASPTARPTTLARPWPRTWSTSTIFTPRSCTSWASTMSG